MLMLTIIRALKCWWSTSNLAFAFPVVHDNVRQTMYEMKNLNFDIELGRADFISLIKPC